MFNFLFFLPLYLLLSVSLSFFIPLSRHVYICLLPFLLPVISPNVIFPSFLLFLLSVYFLYDHLIYLFSISLKVILHLLIFISLLLFYFYIYFLVLSFFIHLSFFTHFLFYFIFLLFLAFYHYFSLLYSFLAFF